MGNEKHKEENILFVHFVNFPLLSKGCTVLRLHLRMDKLPDGLKARFPR
jgi:hypothetical protein